MERCHNQPWTTGEEGTEKVINKNKCGPTVSDPVGNTKIMIEFLSLGLTQSKLVSGHSTNTVSSLEACISNKYEIKGPGLSTRNPNLRTGILQLCPVGMGQNLLGYLTSLNLEETVNLIFDQYVPSTRH